jgi:predicted RNase H-like HicB family nuclease
MEIPVIVEPVAGNGYRATGAAPLGLSAEGATREEALRKLTEAIRGRLRGGAELVMLHLPDVDNPRLKIEGVYKDDPTFDEWQQAIAEYRRQRDAEPDLP